MQPSACASAGTGCGLAGVRFRPAGAADLDALLELLGGDSISSGRSGHSSEPTAAVVRAFEWIGRSADNELIVAERDGGVVGMLQLTLIPGLARGGMIRALIESVHVRADLRGNGIGAALMQHALQRARERGAGIAQLTSDRRRTDAHRFYDRLGFVASHLGMKLELG